MMNETKSREENEKYDDLPNIHKESQNKEMRKKVLKKKEE